MAYNKEESIARMNQLTLVTNYLKQINLNLPLKEIVAINNVMTDYVMNGYSKEIGSRLDAIDKHITSKFENE
jgi:hypothetical protein